jgi:hypothetical protein
VSQYFQTGRTVLWNPSNAIAALFLRTADALVPVVDQRTGLGPMTNDECEIDPEAFGSFVDALVLRYRSSTHPILGSMLEGFLATALVLVERGGGTVPALHADAPATDPRDVSVGPDGIGATGPTARLIERAAEHARFMPH